MSYHPFNPKTPALLPCECPIPEQKKHTTFENCRFGQKKVNFAPSTTTSTSSNSTQPHFAINKVGEKSSSYKKATLSFHHVQTRHKQEALNGKERATRPQQLGVFVSCLTG